MHPEFNITTLTLQTGQMGTIKDTPISIEYGDSGRDPKCNFYKDYEPSVKYGKDYDDLFMNVWEITRHDRKLLCMYACTFTE